jgi:hypothetical protein
MAQHQSQSQSSGGSSQSQSQSQGRAQGQGLTQDPAQRSSLSEPAAPDPTTPYEGPADHAKPAKTPDRVADDKGPAQMEQPYFSEAQSTMGAFAPVERTGDHFAQPEDQVPAEIVRQPLEQASGLEPVSGSEFATASGTVRSGMTVIDSYGHVIGLIAGVEGDRLRLASSDPHDDGVAFLPTSLIGGIEDDRVLLVGRGDASFGMAAD